MLRLLFFALLVCAFSVDSAEELELAESADVAPEVLRTLHLARQAKSVEIHFRPWDVFSDRDVSTGPIAQRIRNLKSHPSWELRIYNAFDFAKLRLLVPELTDTTHVLGDEGLHLVIDFRYLGGAKERFLATLDRVWDEEGKRSAPLPDELKRHFGFDTKRAAEPIATQ